MAHLLIRVKRLVQARDRVQTYCLPILWTVLIVTLIEWWWASFSFRDRSDWNFFYFLFILASPILDAIRRASTAGSPTNFGEAIKLT